MSSDAPAISVRGLSKSYTISHQGQTYSTLAETLLHRARRPFQRDRKETFWALRDVEFDLSQGDVVGIVGRNGAGKSTLLKILSRITELTEGEVAVYGRIGSLLEVGTGFHPELTGRENIFLNGAILGMSKSDIRRQFDAIVEFAGVAKFLDTPVKRYSSGMYVRLAFAVAAHLQSEILIVDEVLAVGDAEFQRKCLGKMKDVASSGRAVLFVSHHMQSVQVLCNRGMYLESGRVKHFGSVAEAIERYAASFARADTAVCEPDRRPGTGELRFTHVVAGKETFTCGETKTVEFTVTRRRPYVGKFFLSAHVVNETGAVLTQCDSRMVGQWFNADTTLHGHFSFRTPWLKPGRYRVEMFICSAGVMDRFEEACHLEVIPLLPYPSPGNEEATSNGVVFSDFAYTAHEPETKRSTIRV
ncbi:MAG: ATP-binding cassette domain-containing protein [Rhodospirillales bacterium]|nr:ATP-binding cassette domain-containing protein [Acetobacter sp.]